MATVNATSANLGTNVTKAPKDSSSALNQDFDDFLTLLTAQLKNQDPTDPTDAAEFTNQLVQFSQVEQQISTNSKLDNLQGTTDDVVFGSALGLLGTTVQTDGDTFQYSTGDKPSLTYTLGADAKKNTVNIVDSNGNTVKTLTAELKAGTYQVVWDGLNKSGQPAGEGLYKLQVKARDDKDVAIAATTQVPAKVIGLGRVDNEIKLSLDNKETKDLEEVSYIKAPNPVASLAVAAEETTLP